ncbi:ABC transporter substrate-binding protein [Paenibacillus nasutitermitis]|uniref:Uncharacterized protein n=1 Tax=Paenibacillus nasutitermitis TaxID=1652958 RepID=A0A916ZGH4_9BACL|nr:extracellular solute-binding protein [Paenibacillus nasutitermitis]GGD96763.1 hypothetical protein GCM10010911_64420 [Paenibacillus nasutitermitis]
MRLKKWVITALTLLLLVSAAACSQNEENASSADTANEKKLNLVFWNSSFPTVDENDKSKRKEDFYIFQAIKRFEAAHPGITIELQDVPGGDNLFTKFQTASIAKNGPDVTDIWSGSYLMRFKAFLEPMNDYFTEEEKSRIVGWEAVTEGFKEQGTIYGVPSATGGTTVLYYNKSIFAKAGVDPEANNPKNFAQFVSMLETVKEKTGITPLGLNMADNFWFIPSYWIAQTITPAGIQDLIDGKMNFADPALVKIIEGWNELYAKNLTMSDQSGQNVQQFYKGQVAMVPGGNWDIPNARKILKDDLGMIKVPDFSEDVKVHNGGVGGAGAAYIVPNYSNHKQEAIDFVKFLNSKEEQENRFKAGETSLTIVKDVDITQYTDEPLILQMQQWSNEPTTMFWPDNIYPPELGSEMNTLQTLVFAGKMSAAEYMERLDAKRDDLLKEQQ